MHLAVLDDEDMAWLNRIKNVSPAGGVLEKTVQADNGLASLIADILTPDERSHLESAIGYGMVEVGGPFKEDDAEVRACRKLGLNPTDWHGNAVLDKAS